MTLRFLTAIVAVTLLMASGCKHTSSKSGCCPPAVAPPCPPPCPPGQIPPPGPPVLPPR